MKFYESELFKNDEFYILRINKFVAGRSGAHL